MLRATPEAASSNNKGSFDLAIAECINHKTTVLNATSLSENEKIWLNKILDEEIDCYKTLNAIDEKGIPAHKAQVKLQGLFADMLGKVQELKSFISSGVRSKDNAAIKEFQNALIAFNKQKPVTEKLITDCDVSFDKFKHLGESLARLDQLFNDDHYMRSKNVCVFLKTKDKQGLVESLNADSIIITGFYREGLNRHNRFKAELNGEHFVKGLKLATEVFARYNALPQSQVKALNHSGSFPPPAPSVLAPAAQPDRRRAMSANGQ